MVDEADDVAVAAITVAELKVGVQLAKGRRREARGAHDLIIAATARARERRVVSLHQTGFGGLPGVSGD